jgi:hypothetical protein
MYSNDELPHITRNEERIVVVSEPFRDSYGPFRMFNKTEYR